MLRKLILAGFSLLPSVLACGSDEHGEVVGIGFNMMGFGFYGLGWMIQLLIIVALGLGIVLLVKNLKGGRK